MADADGPEDLAARCVDWLRDRALQVEPTQVLPRDHGFAWWPGPVCQSVTARPVDSDGGAVLVEVVTDVAEVQAAIPSGRLHQLNDRGTFSAVSAGDTLRLSASMRVYPELFDWQVRLLSWIAALQVAEASDVVDDAIAQVSPLPGSPVVPDAPIDEITGVRASLTVRSDGMAATLHDLDVVLDAAQILGARVEQIPALDDAYRVVRPWTVLPEAALPSFGHHEVVSAVSFVSHQQVGCGLGVRTWFPMPLSREVLERVAPVLNRMDHGLAVGTIGAWLAFDRSLAVTTFLPAGVCLHPDDGAAMLANVLSYHERMLHPALETIIDARQMA